MRLEDLLTRHAVPFRVVGQHHHATTGRVSVDCPRCSPDWGAFRLGLHPVKLYGSCWTCGFVPIVEALHALTGLRYADLRKELDGLERRPGDVVPRGRLVVPKGAGPMLPVHRRYLESRGIDPTHAETVWKIQGIGLAPKLRWRLLLPITLHGRVVSWTTRGVGDAPGLRYVSAVPSEEAINHRELLYGEDLAGHTALVVEGPLDAVLLGPGAVATFGTAVTRAQVRRLARFPRRVVCFDAEPAAQTKARELVDLLSVFPGETIRVELETGKDPGDAKPKEVRQLRRLFLRG